MMRRTAPADRRLILPPRFDRRRYDASFLNAGPQKRAFNLLLGNTGQESGDPFYADTIVVANNQGANNGTVFTNEGDEAGAFPLTRAGAVVTTTAQFPVGDSSARFPGGAWLTVGANYDTGVATDWTHEQWFRTDLPISVGSPELRVNVNGGGLDRIAGIYFFDNGGNQRYLFAHNGGFGAFTTIPVPILVNTWYFLQVVGTVGVGVSYYLGTLDGVTLPFGLVHNSAYRGLIGQFFGQSGATFPLQGWLGPMRVTRAARPAAMPDDIFPVTA